MNDRKKTISYSILLRGIAVGLVFIVVAVYLGMNLSRIQLEEYNSWQVLAQRQQFNDEEVAAARGTIYDSNGEVLATSLVVYTITASPDVIAQSELREEAKSDDPARFASRELARILELDEDTLYEKLSDEDSRYYKVKGQVEKPIADEITQLKANYNLKGIYLEEDARRYYPYGDLASTVLGFVNEGGGASGIEYQYEGQLAGTPGRMISVVNAWGGEMPSGTDAIQYDPVEGYDLELTINAEVQLVVETELAKAVDKYQAAERGMAIVMDVNTGAILAMATSPSYDPNEAYYVFDDATREEIEAMPEGTDAEIAAKSTAQGAARNLQWRNKAVADTYEPGSVFKVITAAAALDSGVYSVNSTFTCGSVIQVADWQMGCAQGIAHGHITLREALIESCNVSFITIGQKLGAQTWYDYLNAFGLTEPTGVDLPGEPSQASMDVLVYAEEKLGIVELSSASFGQSNKYTALQMITAVSAAVNGGYLMQPYVVSAVKDQDGNIVETNEPTVKRQVVSNETSEAIRSILEDLVSNTNGNGNNAYVAGYRVGGKSGTSEKLERRTQDGVDVYISSFLGFAPANDPQVAVLFVLDEPRDTDREAAGMTPNYFGGRLAGPSVGNIISGIMPIIGSEADYGDNEEDLLRTTLATPDVTGLDSSAARVKLNQEGLSYIEVGSGGNVVSQYPTAADSIPHSGQVILYYGDEAQQMATVPDLAGQKASVARATLQGLGLNVITTGALDSGASVGVAEQSVEAGASVPKGTVIQLTMADSSNRSDI